MAVSGERCYRERSEQSRGLLREADLGGALRMGMPADEELWGCFHVCVLIPQFCGVDASVWKGRALCEPVSELWGTAHLFATGAGPRRTPGF